MIGIANRSRSIPLLLSLNYALSCALLWLMKCEQSIIMIPVRNSEIQVQLAMQWLWKYVSRLSLYHPRFLSDSFKLLEYHKKTCLIDKKYISVVLCQVDSVIVNCHSVI